MRMPLLPGISSRSRTSTKGSKTVNVVSDNDNQIAQKRPALVYSEGYGGLGSGLMDTPRGLFSAWDGTVVDEVGCARILTGGSFVEVDITGYSDVYICGMSDDGSVCCGYGTRNSDAKIRALRITVDGVTELAYPSGITGFTWAYGISGDGQTIVGAGKPSSVGMRSYMWKGGVVTELTRATDSTTNVEGGAMSASYDGKKIVGWHVRSGVRKGYVYDVDTLTATYQTLPSPYSASTQVKFLCVSNDGEWIGGNASEFPIIWNPTRSILFDIANGSFGFVTGLSDRGKYASGDYSLDFATSFFYQRTVYQFDNSDPWVATRPYAVGNQVTNDSNKVYICVTEGTTASSGGPTGTGSGIADGTVVWDYVGLATDVVSAAVKTDFSLGDDTLALAISRYGNSVICQVTDTGSTQDMHIYRWNQCGGTFKDSELLGTTEPGSGQAIPPLFPKGAAASGMAGHVGTTQFSPSFSRIASIWVPSE